MAYAHCSQFAKHDAAAATIRKLAEGKQSWGLPTVCIREFLRIVTHAKVLTSPFTIGDAIDAVTALLASPTAEILLPGDQHWLYLAEAAEEADTRGNLIFDAAIVAICRENGVTELVTEDRDFDRFKRFPTSRIR